MSFSIIVVDFGTIKKTIDYMVHFSKMCEEGNESHYIIIDNYGTKIGYSILEGKYGKPKEKSIKSANNVYEYATEYGKLIYCYTGENLGYARANNIGTLIVDELYGDDYYIVSNNDITIKNFFSLKIFKDIFTNNQDVAVIGPRVVGVDHLDQSPRKKIGFFKYFILQPWIGGWPFYWLCDNDYTGASKRCYFVTGCFVIIRAKAFQMAGRYDANTFMFAEEPILSERLSRVGFVCYFYDDFTVIHEDGGTVKKHITNYMQKKWNFDSSCYYYEKYRNIPKVVLGVARINFMLSNKVDKIKRIIKSKRMI